MTAYVTAQDQISSWTDAEIFDISAGDAAIVDSVQLAFFKREVYTYVWPTVTERNAETTMVPGSEGYQADTQITYKYDGSQWRAWHSLKPTAFTPAWTNLSLGNGSQAWTYTLTSGIVEVQGYLTLGSTSTVGTGPYMTLPLPANGLISGAPNSGNDQSLGTVLLEDAGINLYPAFVTTKAVSSVIYAQLSAGNASTTYLVIAAVAAAVPFTWGVGDFLTASYSYKAD